MTYATQGLSHLTELGEVGGFLWKVAPELSPEGWRDIATQQEEERGLFRQRKQQGVSESVVWQRR